MNFNYINNLSPGIIGQLQQDVENVIARSGLYARVFSRQKDILSIEAKFNKKRYSDDKKMQDLFGVRIALYFKDDIEICRKLIFESFKVVDISEDLDTATEFKPKRLNIVCKLPSEIMDIVCNSLDFNDMHIDTTFELQIRTIFSEGWHEIEHDLRYKRQKEWIYDQDDSRILNGIYATLETCDWAIIQLFEQRALSKYLKNEIAATIINKYRIKFTDFNISQELENIIKSDPNILKKIYNCNRNSIIEILFKSDIPIIIDNFIYLLNFYTIHNEVITHMTPKLLLKKFKKLNPAYFNIDNANCAEEKDDIYAVV